MSANNRAASTNSRGPADSSVEARAAMGVKPIPTLPATVTVPKLKVQPLLRTTATRRFTRVPTHSFGVFHEQREYPRACLRLPLRLRSICGVPEEFPVTLVTRDVSSTGAYFLCPRDLNVGTKIEIEIVLVNRPLGRGNVVIATHAHVRRIERAATPGWFGVAVAFDELEFDRDDSLPSRYLLP